MAYDEKAHKKSQRQERIAAGLCGKCGKTPPRSTHKTCERCAKLGRASTAKYRRTYPEKLAASNRRARGYQKEWRDRRREAGLCVDCGAPARAKGYVRCQACLNRRKAYGAKFRAADPERQAWYTRKHKYGITREEWGALFVAQGKRCPICGTMEPGGRGKWHTDHNHANGEVRGILCNDCNLGLGAFHDDPVRLRRAAGYLVIKGGQTRERQGRLSNVESA